ncbi:MAG: CCA tRNA nucleotidyltransferase [Elusimicrobiota bacterium]|jgi:tRNA nucleotidyltransferase/poly(A) polymerase|nr:CCA tRNA nucleotidyltransferase [Elusimicrobiota bacterium]
MKLNFPQKFISVIEKIDKSSRENNLESFIVGGFVRDLILKKEPKDMDIMVCPKNFFLDKPAPASCQNPGIFLAQYLHKKYPSSSLVVFEKFGTAKLLIDEKEIEFVMPRKEVYTNQSRNPHTTLGTIKQDAIRRDFTVNALFLKISDGEILDLTKMGIEDIKNKILRVTDPENAEFIFNQDPLRILRAIRFSGQLDFPIEPHTFTALSKTVQRISIVSPERIRDEIIKILLCQKPAKLFETLNKLNLIEIIFKRFNRAEIAKSIDEKQFEILDKTPQNFVLRMCAFLYPFKEKENVEIILKGLKIPKSTIYEILDILKNVELFFAQANLKVSFSDEKIRFMVYSCGKNFANVLDFAQLIFSQKFDFAALKKRIEFLKQKDELFINDRILNGNEIMHFFNLPSGFWLKQVKENMILQLCKNIKISRNELLEKLKSGFKEDASGRERGV